LPLSIPGLTTPAAPASAAVPAGTPGIPQAKIDMPALPGALSNLPAQIRIPGDLPALAAPGAQPAGTPAAPAAPAPSTSILSALP
jgi:hypothetical protein